MTAMAPIVSEAGLDDAQRDRWLDAVATVDEIAGATDSSSASKAPLTALQRLVRLHPVTVVDELGETA
jgi:hypothetical protein